MNEWVCFPLVLFIHSFMICDLGIVVPSVKSVYWSHIGVTKQSNLNAPSSSDLFHWLAAQSALACINSKLRIPLGKPQDTFLSIEGTMSLRLVFMIEKIEFHIFSIFGIGIYYCLYAQRPSKALPEIRRRNRERSTTSDV